MLGSVVGPLSSAQDLTQVPISATSTNSAWVHYTQASATSADSSISSSAGTPNQSCFISMIKCIASFIYGFWLCKAAKSQCRKDFFINCC